MGKASIPILIGSTALILICGTAHSSEKTLLNPVFQESEKLDIAQLLKKRKVLYLSGIAKSISYIPLETNPKYLIGNKTVRVKPCGDYFFVSEHEKPVGVFSRTGKFIRTIGNIGKGPGEYNSDYTFWPDSTTRQIYIWNANYSTLMCYSFEGKHMGDIKPGALIFSFVPLGNDQFVTWTHRQMEFEGKFYRLFYHDKTGKTSKRYFETERPLDISGGIMSPLFIPTDGGFLYNNWEDEAVYRLETSGSFRPALTWTSGNLKMPPSLLNDHKRFMREKDNYVLDVMACETQSTWFIRFFYKNQTQMAIRSKLGGEEFLVANPDTAQKGVYNDIDGGPSFWPFTDNEGGRQFVRVIDAIDFIDYGTKTKPSPVPLKKPDQAAELKKLISSLNENSNPVVMLVTLK